MVPSLASIMPRDYSLINPNTESGKERRNVFSGVLVSFLSVYLYICLF